MLQNVYSLPDLIDLALTVPEVGAVNFNILHTVLHTIVQELKLTDVRPWCHIENPLIAKTAYTKAKLQEASQRRIASESSLGEKVGLVFPGGGSLTVPGDRDVSRGRKDTTTISSKRESVSEFPKKSPRDEDHTAKKQIPTKSYSASQTEEAESKHSDTIPESTKKSRDEDRTAEEKKIPTRKDSAIQTEKAESKASDTTPDKTEATSETSSKRESASESSTKPSSDEDRPATQKQTPSRRDSTIQTEEDDSKASDTTSGKKDATATVSSKRESASESSEQSTSDKQSPTRRDSTMQTEVIESKASDTNPGKKDDTATTTSSKRKSASESSKKSSSDEDRPATEKRRDSAMQTEESESKATDTTPSKKDNAATPSKEESAAEPTKKLIHEDPQATEQEVPEKRNYAKQPSEKSESEASEPIPEDSATHEEPKQLSSQREEEKKEVEQYEPEKSSKRPQKAGDAWKYRNLSTRVEATEEGLYRLSNIVDIIADKLRKADKRKKEGGPASEELEAIDERLLEVEEALARLAADHDLLMELEKTLRDMLKEFEAIKALAALLKQMQLDISKKADKEETWAALALKGDLELVNTKVDQLEFETAIEELGEAIGLLGLKFTRKNDEWEERAAEIWRGIDSKMSRDIFDAAVVKIESRLTALMYGLKKLKEVVEELLYPQSSGVTRCILCRRPACISGLECIGIYGSPKRPHSDKSSGDEDSDKLKQTLNDAVVKRKKLDAPPYCESHDTIISIPYSSSSYRSSDRGKTDFDVSQIKLMPKSSDKERVRVEKSSQVPKLPRINDVDSGREAKRSRLSVSRMKSKQKNPKADLVFTMRKLDEYERNKERSSAEEQRYTAVKETEAPKSLSSRDSSKSSWISISTIPDPEEAATVFLPAKLMTDPLRRDVLRSPTSPKEHKSGGTISPLHPDADQI